MSSRITFACGVLVGVIATVVFRGSHLEADAPPAQHAVAPTADDVKAVATYANSYRLHLLNDSLVLDLGLNMPKGEAGAGAAESQFTVSDRIAMSYYTVKKLQNSLAQVVKRYEEKIGPIQPPPGEVDPAPAR